MQAVKPEWATLQAQFAQLALDDRIEQIINELRALQVEVAAESNNGAGDRSTTSVTFLSLTLRRIQRYVEWTVPELLPERAEEAETLVNVARLAARLLLQDKAWNPSDVITEIELRIEQLSAIHSAIPHADER